MHAVLTTIFQVNLGWPVAPVIIWSVEVSFFNQWDALSLT